MVHGAIFLLMISLGFNQGWYHNELQTDVIRVSDFFCVYLLFEGLNQRSRNPRTGRLVGLATVMLLWAFVGYFQSRYNYYFWRQWLDMFRGIVTFVALTSVLTTPRRLRLAVTALLTLGVIEVALGMLQWKYGAIGLESLGFENFGGGRVTGTFVHPNMMGTFLAVILALSMTGVVGKRHRHWFVYAGVTVFLAAGLMLTFSRTGWVAAAVGAFGMLAVALWSRRISIATVAVLLILQAGAVGFLVLKYPQMFLDRIETARNEVDTTHAASRLSLALEAVELVREKPVTGVGLGNYEFEVDNWLSLRTHTTYLYVAAETGLIGLAIYLLILGKAFFLAFQDRRILDDPAALLACGLVGSHLAFAVASLTDLSPWADATIMQLLWVILALTVANHRIARTGEEAPDNFGALVAA